jgi:hypothetical protein
MDQLKKPGVCSTWKGAELLRAGGRVALRDICAGPAPSVSVLSDRSVPGYPMHPGFDIESPAVEAWEVTAEAIRGETFMPIRALLPVWTDEITGAALDLDELRAALMGSQ